MKNEDTITVHLKLPLDAYYKLTRKAKAEMRTMHSLAVYVLSKYASRKHRNLEEK